MQRPDRRPPRREGTRPAASLTARDQAGRRRRQAAPPRPIAKIAIVAEITRATATKTLAAVEIVSLGWNRIRP